MHRKFVSLLCLLLCGILLLSGCNNSVTLADPTATSVVLPTRIPRNTPAPKGDQLYLSDFRTGLVERVDLTTLEISVFASGLHKPEDGACNSKGQIFFAEASSGQIWRFNTDGSEQIPVLDPALRTPEGQEFRPDGLSFDANRDLFFNTSGTPFMPEPHTGVYRITGGDPTNKPERVIPPFTVHGEGTAFLSTGELLAVDWTNGRIMKSRPPQFGAGEVFASDIPSAHGIAIDSHDNVYVSEGGEVERASTSRIFRFDAIGNSLGVFRTLQAVARHMEFDTYDNLYVGTITGGVYKISPNGQISRIAQGRHVSGLALCKAGQTP